MDRDCFQGGHDADVAEAISDRKQSIVHSRHKINGMDFEEHVERSLVIDPTESLGCER